jgi:hypothetical protein
MFDIESYLTKLMGDFSKKFSPINNSNLSKISYSKNLFRYPTIQMVVVSPLLIHNYTNEYILNKNSQFNFFLYDTETDMIIGEIEEIDFDENWDEELSFRIYDAENKLPKYVCPSCEFWLVQRVNKYGHRFLGCCGYPECDFSCEIDDLGI